MLDLIDENNQTILRNIVREEVHAEIGDFDGRVRTIVREETADIRDDVKTIKHVQGQQGIMIRTTQTDVNSLKSSFRHQANEMTRIGVLLEDLEHRFEAGTELG